MVLPTFNINDPFSIAILNGIAGKVPSKETLYWKDISLIEHWLSCADVEIIGYRDLFTHNIVFESKVDKIIFNPFKYFNFNSIERKEFNHQFCNFISTGKRFIDI